MPKKAILILLDGLADWGYPEFQGRTPLAAAKTPNLDALAARGSAGLYHAASQGMALPSENAHFSMFGYGPEAFPGRGWLEALGAGVSVKPGQVSFLAHLSAARPESRGLVLVKTRPEVAGEDLQEMMAAVSGFRAGGVRFRFHPTRGVDGVLLAEGPVSRFVSDTDPIEEGLPLMRPVCWREHADSPSSRNMARALVRYLSHCHRVLAALPANRRRERRGELSVNAVVTQRAGQYTEALPFRRRWGLSGLSIASGIVYWGLARHLGLSLIQVRDSGNPGEDLARRIGSAFSASDRHDFIHVHTKAPDEAGHAKDPLRKKAVIEDLDRGLGQALSGRTADPDLLWIVTADHATPCRGPLVHSGETVPLVFAGEGVRQDRVTRFDEVSCAGGALGQVRGEELMLLVLNHLERTRLHGLRDSPGADPFWPGDRKPFVLSGPGE